MLYCICFLVVELVFLWVFLREFFPPMGFLPLFFSPVGMLGSILLNLNPVCPQLLFLCAVLWRIDVLLTYSLACTSAPYHILCDACE